MDRSAWSNCSLISESTWRHPTPNSLLAAAPPQPGLTGSGLGSQDMVTSFVYRSPPLRLQISDQTFRVPFRPGSRSGWISLFVCLFYLEFKIKSRRSGLCQGRVHLVQAGLFCFVPVDSVLWSIPQSPAPWLVKCRVLHLPMLNSFLFVTLAWPSFVI